MSSETTRHSQQTETDHVTHDAETQLEVLGNQCSRTILLAVQEGPKTAKELTDRTDCSSATVYRRINDLLENDLVEECIRFERGGSHTTAYRALVEGLDIRFGPDDIRLERVESE
ncbi:HTH domain-containing protein [Halovivax ruber XH-70]|uniref:HTH domain-containing protein n=1 Tax=Halovivax ruber (strain DSM 18193 / JCM 13892 / XH-70) TaxID=797302 RepID=L0IDA7_HALRX|nr:helix-turn-helix domain-containing protein [Halovivax ruber]AGB16211.1 HTH domain-containing protein [Halovivax ruber XH-70]